MKIYLSLILLLFLIGCSFDDKSGIWKNENDPNINQKNDSFASFKSLSSSNKVFNEVIPFNNKKKIKLSKRVSPENWTDIIDGHLIHLKIIYLLKRLPLNLKNLIQI